MKSTTVNERIALLIENQKINPNSFANRLTVKPTVIYNILKGRNKPSFDLVNNIIDVFGLNAQWLMTGNGTMYSNDETESTKDISLVDKNANYIKEKVLVTDRLIEDVISKSFPTEQLSLKSKNLRELQNSYIRKVNSELRNKHKDLYNIMESAEDLETLCDQIWTAVSQNINRRPNPFDPMQYLDLKNKSEVIPATIDYENYKDSVISWLKTISKFSNVIAEFSIKGNEFLTKLDTLSKSN